MERFTVTVKDIIRQDDGRHTIVFNNGDLQPNVGICLHGDMIQTEDCRFYMISFEVVPESNPIIKAKS